MATAAQKLNHRRLIAWPVGPHYSYPGREDLERTAEEVTEPAPPIPEPITT